MINIDNLKFYIRDKLVSDSTIYGYVKDRVYFTPLINVPTLTYPVLSIRFASGAYDYNIDVGNIGFDIVSYSDKSEGEAYSITTRVINILHRLRDNKGSTYFVFYSVNTPITDYLDEDRLYFCPVSFLVRILET